MITIFAKMWNSIFEGTSFRITSDRKWVIHEYLKYFCFSVILIWFTCMIVGVIKSVV